MFVVGVSGEVEFYLRYAALPCVQMNLMLSSVLCLGHQTQSSGIKQMACKHLLSVPICVRFEAIYQVFSPHLRPYILYSFLLTF